MSNIEYDFGIPIPASERHTARGGRADAIRNLPIGGSKFFPDASRYLISATISVLKKRGQLQFTVVTRTRTEDGIKGIRVWRLDDVEDAAE